MREFDNEGKLIQPSLDEKLSDAVFDIFQDSKLTTKEAEEALDRLKVKLKGLPVIWAER